MDAPKNDAADHMLMQQNRYAAMGEMISNIAHQWRQPLNALGLTIQRLPLLQESCGLTKKDITDTVDQCMDIIRRMSGTIEDFRNFFVPDREKSEFTPREVVGKAVRIVEASFKSRQIAIMEDFAEDPVIFGFPNEYSQVILNVLNNAKDAIEARGTTDPRVVITSRTATGRSILTISDNAGGISDDVMPKIFEPYFTTKGPQGTGVGLFMAKQIIEKNMNGRMSARNTGRGAEFTIEV